MLARELRQSLFDTRAHAEDLCAMCVYTRTTHPVQITRPGIIGNARICRLRAIKIGHERSLKLAKSRRERKRRARSNRLLRKKWISYPQAEKEKRRNNQFAKRTRVRADTPVFSSVLVLLASKYFVSKFFTKKENK